MAVLSNATMKNLMSFALSTLLTVDNDVIFRYDIIQGNLMENFLNGTPNTCIGTHGVCKVKNGESLFLSCTCSCHAKMNEKF